MSRYAVCPVKLCVCICVCVSMSRCLCYSRSDSVYPGVSVCPGLCPCPCCPSPAFRQLPQRAPLPDCAPHLGFLHPSLRRREWAPHWAVRASPGPRLPARPAPGPPKAGYKFPELPVPTVPAASGPPLEGPATSRRSHRHHLPMAEGEYRGQHRRQLRDRG